MKSFSKLLAGVATCLFLMYSANGQEADLVLRNGVIWTVDDNNPEGEAIASRNDRIVYVGSNVGVEQLIFVLFDLRP